MYADDTTLSSKIVMYNGDNGTDINNVFYRRPLATLSAKNMLLSSGLLSIIFCIPFSFIIFVCLLFMTNKHFLNP